jgi:hypothetical protein
MAGKLKNDRGGIGWGALWVASVFICAILGFFAGSMYTKQVTLEGEKGYLKQLLINAISEIDYNSQISYYNDQRLISAPQPYPELRTQALLQVYYNSHRYWAADSAFTPMILKCLNDIDWINLLVPSQYTEPMIVQYADKKMTRLEVSSAVLFSSQQQMARIHKELQSVYQNRVKQQLEEVNTFLKAKLDALQQSS